MRGVCPQAKQALSALRVPTGTPQKFGMKAGTTADDADAAAALCLGRGAPLHRAAFELGARLQHLRACLEAHWRRRLSATREAREAAVRHPLLEN